MDRTLAAILAIDVVGYSRLMGADEEGTLANLHQSRALIDETVAAHGGRTFGVAGDSAIAEFSSPVKAVEAAIAIQSGMAELNKNLPETRKMQLRIGANLGDVVVDGDALFGEGVNVAARMEQQAPPGGIILSRTIRDQIRDRLDVTLADLGDIKVKNVTRPVRMFQILRDGERPIQKPAPKRRILPILLTLIALIAVGVGSFLWNSVKTDTPTQTALALPDKPSIAVLPFQDLSQDNPQDWFGDGMAEDIITDLSKLSGLFVISRNSSFKYHGDGFDLRQIGQDLGVAYLLEGSVRRAGETLRINAQLIDANTGAHVWAERYDGQAGDVFALQDRVTAQVVQSLKVALSDAEATNLSVRPTDSPEAHNAYLQGINHLHQRTPADFAKAKRWFDQALLLDPAYPDALSARADLYLDAFQRGWTAEIGISPAQKDAVIPAILAALQYPSARAYRVESEVHSAKPDPKGEEAAILNGLALVPNDPDLLMAKSFVAARAGDKTGAFELVRRAMRLNPNFPPDYLKSKGMLHYNFGETEAAEAAYSQALEGNPEDWHLNLLRAAVFAELGRLEEAAADIAIVKANWPRDWTGQFVAPVAAWIWGRFINEDHVQRLQNALILAGVPQVPDGFEILPENRLSRADIEARVAKGIRIRGRIKGGEWMVDTQPDFTQKNYWKGTATYTSNLILSSDGSYKVAPDGWFQIDRYCQNYRNPNGSNETLNTHVAVCTNGFFYYGSFPLPE